MNISFEFFPPKDNIAKKKLWKTVLKLKSLKPSFFSVTCGANGSTNNLTFNTVQSLQNKTNVITAPHLTCVNLNKYQIKQIALKFWNNNIKNIVALRGDSIHDCKNNLDMDAAELVYFLKKIANFDISVAAYPEIHPKAKNAQTDLINLKRKIDNGANRAITQFFFNVDHYLRFRDNCVAIGINVEIIPGILPILNFQQLKKFSAMTNVCIPAKIFSMFQTTKYDSDIQKFIGSFITTEMVKKLYNEGVQSFHFYTLNNADIVCSICHILKFI